MFKTIVRSKIGRSFLLTVLLLSLPALGAAWFGILAATNAVRRQTHAVLRAASDGAEAQLREFLQCLHMQMKVLSSDDTVLSILTSSNASPRHPPALNKLLTRTKIMIPEAEQLICLDRSGMVIATDPELPQPKDASASDYFRSGQHSIYPGDILRDSVDGRIQWTMSAPVIDPRSGELLGVIALAVNPAVLSDITTGRRVLSEGADTQSFRMGQTGETYLVDRNGYLITESRFAPGGMLKVRVDTEPIRAARQGKEMMGDYHDYRGILVSGSSAIFRNMGWVLLTEIDFSQVFLPIVRLRNALLALAAAAACFGAMVMAARFSEGIARPLQQLVRADSALARGDERNGIVDEDDLPGNEIGEFAKKRNERVRQLIERQRDLLASERRRAQAAAELEQISYSMVHDMRAPLRTIMRFGQLLSSEASDRLSDAEQDYIVRMRAACLRMDRLICDLMQYSALLHAEVPLSAVAVSELLLALIEGNSKLKMHSRQIRVQPGMPHIRGNVRILEQCFAALLDNAIRYSRPGVEPQVEIAAETREGRVRIMVKDNGTGMPKHFQQRVFGIFQKGTNSAEGSGIGLALVRVAVERMGGHVGVTSEEGSGSRFWIDLAPS